MSNLPPRTRLEQQSAPEPPAELRQAGVAMPPRRLVEPTSVSTRALQGCLGGLDVLVLAAGGLVAGYLVGHLSGAILPVIIATLASAKSIAWCNGYRIQTLCSPERQLRIAAGACTLWAVTGSGASLALPESEQMAAMDFGVAAAACLILLGGMRCYVVSTLRHWSRTGRLDRSIAVVGVNDVSDELIQQLRNDPSSSVRFAGAYRTPGDPAPVTHAGVLVRGGIDDLLQHTRSGRVDLVIVAMPTGQRNLAYGIVQLLGAHVCDVAVFSGLEAAWPSKAHLEHLGGGLTLVVSPRPLGCQQGVHKAIFDRIVSFFLLVVLIPVFAMITIAIRCTSPGPILFRQERFGYNHQRFRILKFRTMHHHLTDPLADRQTAPDDDRVTWVGRLLRRTSLDELPQLINVLVGDMSLVGPRPHAPGTRAGTRELDDVATDYPKRHRVKPGITGLAQINGCRGAIRTEEQARKRVEYDLSYIEEWSFFSDLKILSLTLVRGFVGKNAF